MKLYFFIIYLISILFSSTGNSIFGVNRGKFLLISSLKTAGIYGRLRLGNNYRFIRFISDLDSNGEINFQKVTPNLKLSSDDLIIGVSGEISNCEKIYSLLKEVVNQSYFLERDYSTLSIPFRDNSPSLSNSVTSITSPLYISSILKKIVPRIGGVQALVGGKVNNNFHLLLVDGNGEISEMNMVAIGVEMNLLLASIESILPKIKQISIPANNLSPIAPHDEIISSDECENISSFHLDSTQLLDEANEIVEVCWQAASRRTLSDLSHTTTLMLTKSL